MCWALCFAVVLFGGLQLNLRCTLAQDQGLFPTRTVKIVTAAAPGGNPDLLARLLSQKLLERFGKPFVIESVPGAAGTLAARSVSAAPPDGYTLTIIDVPGLSVSAALNQSLGTSPGADLTPVASLVSVPTILVVRPELPVRSLKDFVELARARPKELTFGSGGVGSVHHLTMEIFASRSGIELLHVPYRGGSAMVNGLLTGEIQSGWAGIPSVASLIEDGRLRALCISIASRSASLPEIPTCSEAGYSGFRSRIQSRTVRPSSIAEVDLVRAGGVLHRGYRRSDCDAADQEDGNGSDACEGQPICFISCLGSCALSDHLTDAEREGSGQMRLRRRRLDALSPDFSFNRT